MSVEHILSISSTQLERSATLIDFNLVPYDANGGVSVARGRKGLAYRVPEAAALADCRDGASRGQMRLKACCNTEKGKHIYKSGKYTNCTPDRAACKITHASAHEMEIRGWMDVRARKLGALPYNLLHGVQEITLGCNLPPCADGEHASFCGH